MREVVIDFETISQCDLKACGAPRYAEDLSTGVLCLSSDIDHVPQPTWFPGDPMPAWVTDPDCMIIAHNALFEKSIWRAIMVKDFGWPDIPDERWDDTMAACAMKQLPQALDDVSRVLHLTTQKDKEGSKLTVGLSKPNRKTGNLPEITPSTLYRVGLYCETDVLEQRELRDVVGTLTPEERKVWLMDQRINQRGIGIDMQLVHRMQRILADATGPLCEDFLRLTGVSHTQGAKFKDWLHSQNCHLDNLQAETVAKALGSSPDYGDWEFDWPPMAMTPDAKRALQIKQLVTSAAIKKLDAAEAVVMMDGRARGLLRYHAAGPGRWAGSLLQPHNFPRPTLKEDGELADPRLLVEALMTGDYQLVEMVYGPAVAVVVSALRHILLAAPDNAYIAGDFSGIEARLVLAHAGATGKVALLASGADVYCDMASQIYGRPVNKKNDPEERQIGKNSVLGLGFGMGPPKFRFKYAQNQPLEFLERVVQTYRKEWAPEVPKLWYALMNASTRAVWGEGPQEAYGVRYEMDGPWLTARLPSGRRLWYYEAHPTRETMPWDEDDVRRSWSYRAKKMNQWRTIKAFGGLLAENCAQGMARDLLVDAMFKCEAENIPIVLTVHDEIVAEVEGRRAHNDLKALEQIMVDRPAWAVGMNVPVAVETWPEPYERYRK